MLILMATLAARLGLGALVDATVRLSDQAGGSPGPEGVDDRACDGKRRQRGLA